MNTVKDEDIIDFFPEYADLYEFDYGTYSQEDWEKIIKIQGS
ncbi:hypothetical protein [Niallia taxi]|nr:hypothetical protein [Niallia taxi]